LSEGVEKTLVAPNQLVTVQIEGIRDSLSRPGEHPIGGPHQAELLAQSVKRDQAPEGLEQSHLLVSHRFPPFLLD
jgi:hypothetical protein